LGILHGLAQIAREYSGPLGRDAVARVLGEAGRPETTGITIEVIVRRVGKVFGVAEQDLLGASRLRSILRARQVAMYLAREVAGLSLPRISAAFARDHSTVLHACRKIVEIMGADALLKARVREVRRECA
jgi:chromosomal replication initiator protein